MSKYSRSTKSGSTFSKKSMDSIATDPHAAAMLHHLMPDTYPPSRIPEDFGLASHVMEEKFTKTLKADSTGAFLIYFCPLTCSWEPIRRGLFDGNVDTSFSSDCYTWYNDNNGITVTSATSAGVPLNNSYTPPRLNNPDAWSTTGKVGINQGQYFRKVRMLGAYISVTYIGKTEARQGILSAAMGLKNFASSIAYANISPSQFSDFPSYHVQTLEQPLICRCRHGDDEYRQYGPYTPYKTIPYYVIQGEGVEPNAPFFITVSRTMETIVTPDIAPLVNPFKVKPGKFGDLVNHAFKDLARIFPQLGKLSPDDAQNLYDYLEKMYDSYGKQFNSDDIMKKPEQPALPGQSQKPVDPTIKTPSAKQDPTDYPNLLKGRKNPLNDRYDKTTQDTNDSIKNIADELGHGNDQNIRKESNDALNQMLKENQRSSVPDMSMSHPLNLQSQLEEDAQKRQRWSIFQPQLVEHVVDPVDELQEPLNLNYYDDHRGDENGGDLNQQPHRPTRFTGVRERLRNSIMNKIRKVSGVVTEGKKVIVRALDRATDVILDMTIGDLFDLDFSKLLQEDDGHKSKLQRQSDSISNMYQQLESLLTLITGGGTSPDLVNAVIDFCHKNWKNKIPELQTIKGAERLVEHVQTYGPRMIEDIKVKLIKLSENEFSEQGLTSHTMQNNANK